MNNTLFNHKLSHGFRRFFAIITKSFVSLLYKRLVNEVFVPEKTRVQIILQDGKFWSVRINGLEPWSEAHVFDGEITLVRTSVIKNDSTS